MNRNLVRGLAATLLGLLALVALPVASVSAHAALESSTPAANSVLEASPPLIVLDYDEEIEASLASVKVFDSDGKAVAVGTPAVGADATIVQATLPELSDGLYAVTWRVSSADGHVVDGAFSFQMGTAATTGTGQDLIDQVRNDDAVNPTVRWVYTVAKFLSLMGAVLLIGVGVWSVQGRPALGERRSIQRVMWFGLASLLVGAAFAFMMFGAQAKGGTVTDGFTPSVWADVVSTQTGRMLWLRFALAVVLGVMLLKWKSHKATWWEGVAGSAALITVVTVSASGHPNSLDPKFLWIALDVIHLSAIVLWLGGLAALTFAGKGWLSEPEAVRPVQRFSMTAFVAVPLIVATGVAATLKLAGGLDDVTATTWGRLLLAKAMVVIAMVAVGGVSRWVLHHDGAANLKRTVAIEAVMGVLIIGLAAGMVGQPPRPPVAATPFSQTVTANGVIAGVSISPGSVGGNDIHLLITPPGGSITPVAAVTARVSLPSANVPFSPVTLTSEGPNHYSGKITFPKPGVWTLELIINITASDSALLKTTVTIP
jgi:copper transport protein